MSDEERNKITAQEGVEPEDDGDGSSALEELPGEATFVGDPPELEPQHDAPLADDSSSEDIYFEGAPMGKESIEVEGQDSEPESGGIGRGKWIDSMLQRIDGSREDSDSEGQALPRLSAIEPATLEVPTPIPPAPAETAD